MMTLWGLPVAAERDLCPECGAYWACDCRPIDCPPPFGSVSLNGLPAGNLAAPPSWQASFDIDPATAPDFSAISIRRVPPIGSPAMLDQLFGLQP